MRRLVVLIFGMCFVAGCPVLSPAPEGKIHDLDAAKSGAGYSLYVPKWYTPEEDWPLVISLHGTFGYDGAHRQVREIAYLADRHGFILVAPQLKSVQGILPVEKNLWRRDLARDRALVLELIDELSDTYNIDTDTVLLTGFSAGGFVMYDAGLRHPDRFHMLIGRSINCSTDIFEEVELTDEARKLNIFLFWGKDDPAADMGWKAYEYLRMRGFYNTRKDRIKGGHWRHPKVAIDEWVLYWADRHKTKAHRFGRQPE